MQLVTGDLWTSPADARVITTNAITTAAGRAVMGRGVALQARQRFPGIDRVLGQSLRTHGNHVADLGSWGGAALVALPTKHHWRQPADLTLIRRSAGELRDLTDRRGWLRVVLPPPGCGAGGLAWRTVVPVLADLDDRFWVLTLPTVTVEPTGDPARYHGRRLDGAVPEFHAAVDALAADTITGQAWQRMRARAEQRRVDADACRQQARGPLRLLVCGSRAWTDRDLLAATLEQVASQHGHRRQGVVLIHGGARGADRLAGELARVRGWQLEVYPAQWDRHGRAAGPRRNARMLRDGRPERVIAFTDDLATSRGTADMVRRAHAAGLPVLVVSRQHPAEGVRPQASPDAAQQLPFQ